MATNKFEDAALQKAVEKNSAKIQGFTERLNQISVDVRRLESWLSECGICIQVWMTIEEEEKYDSCGNVTERIEKSIGWTTQKASWNPSGKWRLTYSEEYHFENTVDFRPLIDTPADIRLRCSAHLPAFVEEVARKVSTSKYAGIVLPDGK